MIEQELRQKHGAADATAAALLGDPARPCVEKANRDTGFGWRNGLAALAVVWISIVACYFETAAVMVRTWARTETYAHGFIVAPIALWLIWRMRRVLSTIDPSPSWFIVPVIALAGFGWLFGKVGTINALTQFAFVAMLVLAVPAILGVKVGRALAYPLLFLFFSVPIGDFLLPTLMEHTADFTIGALRASGVPVYREGLQFVIPNGRWSIVEACSGVRYLIASTMVGTLFAYLSFRTLWRRFAFVGVSIAVPIVANWIRAYLIVMLGYLSDNRIATGVDHIIYGWLFFGLVMLIMFSIGRRWQETGSRPMSRDATSASAANEARARLPRNARETPAQSTERALARSIWSTAAIVAAATLAWPVLDDWSGRADDLAQPQIAAVEVPGWGTTPVPDVTFAPHYEGASATLQQAFTRDGQAVGLFIAYYRNQNESRKLISSTNVLVATTHSDFETVERSSRNILVGGSSVRAKVEQIRNSRGDLLEADQWYWIDGMLTSSEAIGKAAIAWFKLTGRGDDSASLVLFTPAGEGMHPQRALQAFTHDAWPVISAALSRAREGRAE